MLLPLIAILAAADAPHPDLSGMYDIATLTPLQRAGSLGTRLSLTDAEAKALAAATAAAMAKNNQASDPNRPPPPAGGDGSEGPAGNVGGYNTLWVDLGTGAFKIDGQFRTSIIVDPANRRLPAMTPEAAQLAAVRNKLSRPNRGDAWWITENISPGPYDDPELRPTAERCLLAFGTSAGPPALPVMYNNLKQIVQTKDHVMILNEMVHDVRIVRLNAKHEPPEIRRWLGDSIGHWEGDTLVVDTTNFNDQPALAAADRNLHVVERFTRVDAKTLRYKFTVEDPTVWTKPWTGEMVWPSTDARLYEYACHEGNYSFTGILRGARRLEAEALREETMTYFKTTLAVLVLAVGAWRIYAHHAFGAEFDPNLPVLLKGPIVRLEWINPHTWIHLEVTKKDGTKEVWMVEGGTPNSLLRRGLKRDTLKIGQAIIVDGYQAKDRSTRANGRDVTLPDGQKFFLGSSGTGAPYDAPGKDQRK